MEVPMKTRSIVISISFALAACSSDETTKTEHDYDDVASAVGSSMAKDSGGDAAAMSDSTDLALGVMPLGFSLSGAGEFGGERLGLHYSYALVCKDASGGALSVCGASTDRLSAEVEWSGELDLPRLTASVEREGAWTVTGLQADVATLDGAGSFHLDAIVRPDGLPERGVQLDYQAAYDGVQIRVDDRAIIGGRASYDIDAERTAGAEIDARFSMDAEVTFTADGSATLVLDGTHEYRVDLRTGVALKI